MPLHGLLLRSLLVSHQSLRGCLVRLRARARARARARVRVRGRVRGRAWA